MVEAEDGQKGLAALREILRKQMEDTGTSDADTGAAATISGCTLVVLDRDMPVLDGFGFLDALVASRASSDPIARAMATTRVEGCTGNAVEEIRDGFYARGAVGVMNKPVHRETIVQAVARAVHAAGGSVPGRRDIAE